MNMSILNVVVTATVIGINILSCIADDPNNEKVSMAFIIDDTGSMGDDIAAVLEGSQAIFNTIISSPYSPIINYVLTTFNDPTTNLRIVTRDPDEYRSVLKTITVHGGGDCPELCLTGIKQGIENSRYGSFLYVFTDASAKDYGMYEEVKTMALRKGAQIVFVLTGMCGSYDDADYTVYEDLAHATGGEVFHLDKTDIGDILSYVRYTVEGPTTLIASKIFPGESGKFTFKTDPLMKDPLIAVTGDDPKLDVTASDGSKPRLDTMVSKPRIKIAKISDARPDTYSADVSSLSATTVTVIAHTDVQFKPAFSTFLPPLYKYTTTRPVPGVKSYVAVKLTEGDIELTYLKILDMDFNTLSYTPLSIMNVPEKSYITDYMIGLPLTMFRVAVEGYDPETKATITRIATVPVEPQNIDGNEPQKAPTVSVDEDHVKVKVGKATRLFCRVSGLPKPNIDWTIRGVGISLPAKTQISELLYDFISVLDTDVITKDVTYQCSANNSRGSDSKEIYVEMFPTHYLIVVEKPEDIEVEYNREAKLHCRIDAYPKAKITWYKTDKALVELPGDNTNVVVADDKSELTILSMQPEDQDTYVCVAENDIAKKWLPAEVTVTNVDCLIDLDSVSELQPLVLSSKKEWPRYFTDHGKMVVAEHESLTLYCLRGFKDYALRFVTATCVGGSMFKVNGFSVNFKNIECKEQMNHVVESSGLKCLPGNTEKLSIGFGSDKLLNAYELCLDKDKNIPVYTKHHMPRITTGTSIVEDWKDDVDFRINFDELYNCRQQIDTISTILGKWFHRDDMCCFRKLPLVDQTDVFPGVAQRATFSYLNAVPAWSTYSSGNWDSLTTAVRGLASTSELLVFTGISGELLIPTIYGVEEHIKIVDKSGEGQQVPLYLWKVVQNPTTKASLAIIQINVPDLLKDDTEPYIKCKDICTDITWLNGTDWKDVNNGYTYCCDLKSFETGFETFKDVFEPFYNTLY